MGGAGIDAVSSAQLRWVDISVEHGGTGLEGVEARDGGCKTGPGGSSCIVAAMKDGGDDETARLGSNWGEFGCTRGDGVADGEWGVSAVVGGVVNDVAVVCNNLHSPTYSGQTPVIPESPVGFQLD